VRKNVLRFVSCAEAFGIYTSGTSDCIGHHSGHRRDGCAELIGSQKTANERIAYTLVKEMEKAAGNYATDHDGEYFKGNGTEAWQAMINPPAYKGRKLRPYLEEVPIDPWGNPLQYEWNGDGHSKKQNALKPAIWSTGFRWPGRRNKLRRDCVEQLDSSRFERRQLICLPEAALGAML
jgi:hypothetical protein